MSGTTVLGLFFLVMAATLAFGTLLILLSKIYSVCVETREGVRKLRDEKEDDEEEAAFGGLRKT